MAQLTVETCPLCKHDRHTFVALGGPKTSMTICQICWVSFVEDMDLDMALEIMAKADVIIYDL